VPPSSVGKEILRSWSTESFSHTSHVLTTDLTQYNRHLSSLPDDRDRQTDIYIEA